MFFWISKIGGALISPDSLIVLAVLLCCFLLWRGSYKKAKVLLSVLFVAMFLITVLPIAAWLRYPLETRFAANPELPNRIDGIIVLAGPDWASMSSEWQQTELRDGAERYMAFMALSRKYPSAKLVFTGGSGSLTKQQYKAADYAAGLFAEQGLDVNRIIFERESRNTHENAVFSKKIVKPSVGENWVLITSASHMPRSVGLFCKIDWSVIPYPVDHRTKQNIEFYLDWRFSEHLNDLVQIAKEWLGLLAYAITDRINSIYPAGCQ